MDISFHQCGDSNGNESIYQYYETSLDITTSNLYKYVKTNINPPFRFMLFYDDILKLSDDDTKLSDLEMYDDVIIYIHRACRERHCIYDFRITSMNSCEFADAFNHEDHYCITSGCVNEFIESKPFSDLAKIFENWPILDYCILLPYLTNIPQCVQIAILMEIVNNRLSYKYSKFITASSVKLMACQRLRGYYDTLKNPTINELVINAIATFKMIKLISNSTESYQIELVHALLELDKQHYIKYTCDAAKEVARKKYKYVC